MINEEVIKERKVDNKANEDGIEILKRNLTMETYILYTTLTKTIHLIPPVEERLRHLDSRRICCLFRHLIGILEV